MAAAVDERATGRAHSAGVAHLQHGQRSHPALNLRRGCSATLIPDHLFQTIRYTAR